MMDCSCGKRLEAARYEEENEGCQTAVHDSGSREALHTEEHRSCLHQLGRVGTRPQAQTGQYVPLSLSLLQNWISGFQNWWLCIKDVNQYGGLICAKMKNNQLFIFISKSALDRSFVKSYETRHLNLYRRAHV